MTSISIDIKDLNKLSNLLEKAGKRVEKDVDILVGAAALDTERYAEKLVPVNKGRLRSSISSEKVKEMEWKIGSNVDYAPFVEFGTGKKVYIPSEWSGFASQFKGSTGEKWTNALEEIEKWCISKGIPKEAAYPILITILEEGVNANPFLYPAFRLGRKNLIKDIKDYLKNFGIDG